MDFVWKARLQQVVRDVAASDIATLIPWMLKDLGWVTLCAPMAFSAAIFGLVTDVRLLLVEWPKASTGDRAHMASEVLWFAGNSVWMTSEILFEKKQPSALSELPWYSGPLLPFIGEEAYMHGAVLARTLMGLGLVVVACFYIGCSLGIFSMQAPDAALIDSKPKGAAIFGLVPEDLYVRLFMVPWIAKDICWTADFGPGVLLFGAIAFTLGSDCYRRFGGAFFVAELLWLGGNSVWAYSELQLADSMLTYRLIAVTCLLSGIILAVLELSRSRIRQEFGELRPLLMSPATPASAASTAASSADAAGTERPPSSEPLIAMRA